MSKGKFRYLTLLEDFQIRIVTSAKKVATRQGEKEGLTSNFKRRIKEEFVDTMCYLFDGMLNGATFTDDRLGGRRPSRISSARITTVKDIVRSFHDQETPADNVRKPVCSSRSPNSPS